MSRTPHTLLGGPLSLAAQAIALLAPGAAIAASGALSLAALPVALLLGLVAAATVAYVASALALHARPRVGTTRRPLTPSPAAS